MYRMGTKDKPSNRPYAVASEQPLGNHYLCETYEDFKENILT